MIRAIPYILFLELRRKLSGRKWIAEFDATDNCNLRCKHCYHFVDRGDSKFNEVPLEVWEERLRGLYDSGVRLVLIVGGEPALRTDVLMLANKIFPLIYTITNGTIKIPKEFNHRLYVSLDGSEKTNDSIRGRGVFSKVLKNYTGDKRVVINMTITQDNYTELEDVVKIAKKSGFFGVVCNIFMHEINCESPLIIQKSERVALIKELRRVKKSYPNVFLLSKAMINWYERPDHRSKCYWGSNVIHLDASWKRRHCFSNLADCSECGCFAGASQIGFDVLIHSRGLLKMVFM